MLVTAIAALLGAVVFVELFLRLPVINQTKALSAALHRSAGVMKSRRISDHWKERVLPRYSAMIMAGSLKIGLFLIICLAAFCVVYCGFFALFGGGLDVAFASMLTWQTQLLVIILGACYAFARQKLAGKPKVEGSEDYGLGSRVLHHIALNYSFAKEMAFDLDCSAQKVRDCSQSTAPVYVTGLARAGTTILLEALYSTGQFASLTYRHMPFVTAPYLWKKISDNMGHGGEKRERAHGDGIMINYDSPEAFEEVFWLTFSRGSYVEDDCLRRHTPGAELMRQYKRYVCNVVASGAQGENMRYLAKNNNNIIRIPALLDAFEDAKVIIAVRHPLKHAQSLLNQHARFMETHALDVFSLKYMNWLGHFEFGANHKQFHFHDGSCNVSGDPMSLDYWVEYWRRVHEYLYEQYAGRVVFFSHEKLCAQPEQCLANLEALLCLHAGSLAGFAPNIKRSEPVAHVEFSSRHPQTQALYEQLLGACA